MPCQLYWSLEVIKKGNPFARWTQVPQFVPISASNYWKLFACYSPFDTLSIYLCTTFGVEVCERESGTVSHGLIQPISMLIDPVSLIPIPRKPLERKPNDKRFDITWLGDITPFCRKLKPRFLPFSCSLSCFLKSELYWEIFFTVHMVFEPATSLCCCPFSPPRQTYKTHTTRRIICCFELIKRKKLLAATNNVQSGEDNVEQVHNVKI